MSMNKWLIASVVGGCALASALPTFAGGPAAQPEQPALYAELDGGWVGRNLISYLSGNFSTTSVSESHYGRGSWSLGGALGYQATQFFSAEIGYWDSRKATGYAGTTPVSVKTWFTYAAGKMTVPVMNGFSVFGKFGPVYVHSRANNVTKSGTALLPSSGSSVVSDYWDVMYAVGTEYRITPNWVANAQFLRVPGYDHINSTDYNQPSTTVYSVGVAYKFML